MTNRNALVLAASLLAALSPSLAADDYVRISAGPHRTHSIVLRDADCTSTSPAALFGCGTGVGGEDLGARGELADGFLVELSAGRELGPHLRGELSLFDAGDLDFTGNANFTGASDQQPVAAEIKSTALLAMAAWDFFDESDLIRPFLSAGAGAAFNRAGDILFLFPSIDPAASTVVKGGRQTDLAWTASAGVAIRISPSVAIELAVRHLDLGTFRTETGNAVITRPAGIFNVDVAPVEAPLELQTATLSIRVQL